MNIIVWIALIIMFIGLMFQSFWTMLLALIIYEIGSGGRGLIAWFLTGRN